MRGRSRARGLTLIELMLTILGCSLLLQVMLGAITSGLQAERNADLRGTAIRLASSEVARFKMIPFDELEAGQKSVELTLHDRPFTVTTSVAVSREVPEHLREMSVVVTWEAGARDLSYTSSVMRSRL